MLIDLCLTPVSEARPCGEDLREQEDAAYLNYMATVGDRLPQGGYYIPAKKYSYNPAVVKVEAEEARIFPLLERSKDIRLLALLAQFRAIASDFSGFAECLEAIAAVLRTWWTDAHPAFIDGDLEMRNIALDILANPARGIAPLNYLKLYYDNSSGYVSLRQYKIGQRPEIAIPDRDEVIDLVAITRSVAGQDNREEVLEAYSNVERSQAALKDIIAIWEANDPSSPAPNFEELFKVLAEMEAFLKLGAGEDKKPAAGAPDKDEPEPAPGYSGLMQAVRAVFRPDPAKAKTVRIRNHAEARAALTRLEDYFQTQEPSSPSGLLVRQARMLVGRPLIEALEALAPAKVESVVIQIDKASGFSLDAGKIRALSVVDASEDNAILVASPLGAIETREDVFLAIQVIEEFLIETEPSSPVPMLLGQARIFMSKDFSAIMNELLQPEK